MKMHGNAEKVLIIAFTGIGRAPYYGKRDLGQLAQVACGKFLNYAL